MHDDRFGQPSPWHSDNPYTPPTSYDDFESSLRAPEGTYWGGFAAGLVAALIGLLLVHVFGKAETKRGALHGLLARIGLVLFIVFVTAMFG